MSINDLRELALTVHLVGQSTLKPGESGASFSFSFSSIVSRFGEYFTSLDTSDVVSNALCTALSHHQLPGECMPMTVEEESTGLISH